MTHLRWAPRRNHGFTIVELLIVIVVIGILASLTVVAFNGIQRRASTVSIKSDLTQAAKSLHLTHAKTGEFPAIIPPDVKASPGTTLRLVATGTPIYEDMSPVQQGVLLHSLCNELVTEGYGNGMSLGGQVGTYVTSCNVYGWQNIQLNGWQSHSFSVPLGATTIRDWYNSRTAYDAWWPDQKTVTVNFANELSARYTAMGGTFPVASFWDTWSSGVQQEPLPTPTPPHNPAAFCLEGTHSKYDDIIWHVANNQGVTEGGCS